MQELLSEQESVRETYEFLEGEYMLVYSELSAARDRISKLLVHLEKHVLLEYLNLFHLKIHSIFSI